MDLRGNLAAAYRYTAFGEKQTLMSNLTQDNPWGYSSKRYDSESGFINFGRRYYVPEIGRFITADPAGYVDGPNLYAYVHNHPLAYIDPDGRFFFLLAPIVISLAIDYIGPAATAYLVEATAGSAIGTTVAGAVIGVVKGYNGDYLDACAMPGTPGYYSEMIGRAVGGACSIASPKAVFKGGSQFLKMGTKGLVTDVAKKTVLEGADHAAKSVAQKVANETKKQFAKKGRKLQRPDPLALGEHTTFRRNSTGKITHYETYIPQTNSKNPNKWEVFKRYDNVDPLNYHYNKVLEKKIYEPHIHDPFFPGDVRIPLEWEMPK